MRGRAPSQPTRCRPVKFVSFDQWHRWLGRKLHISLPRPAPLTFFFLLFLDPFPIFLRFDFKSLASKSKRALFAKASSISLQTLIKLPQAVLQALHGVRNSMRAHATMLYLANVEKIKTQNDYKIRRPESA